MELLKLLGILIVVIGFVLKLDSILIIMIAAIVTALVAGMDPVTFLETLGSSFVANRSMCVFVMVMVVTGTLERNGLKQAAANLMKKFKNASAGVVLAIYGVFRLVFAAFNVSFGGVAGFVRPIVLPMASAAAKKNGKFFAKNSTVATPLPMTETLGENSTDINTTRNKVISEVALGNMTVEEGMKLYKDRVGTAVEAVLKSLNETKKSK